MAVSYFFKIIDEKGKKYVLEHRDSFWNGLQWFIYEGKKRYFVAGLRNNDLEDENDLIHIKKVNSLDSFKKRYVLFDKVLPKKPFWAEHRTGRIKIIVDKRFNKFSEAFEFSG